MAKYHAIETPFDAYQWFEEEEMRRPEDKEWFDAQFENQRIYVDVNGNTVAKTIEGPFPLVDRDYLLDSLENVLHIWKPEKFEADYELMEQNEL